MPSNYGFRKDQRTDEQFKQDIETFTKFEAKCMKRYFDEEILPKYPNAKLIDNGTDNSGKVDKGEVSGDEDFLVKLNDSDSVTIEVKASPVSMCATVKDHCITSLLKKDCYVLIVLDGHSKHPDFLLCKSSEMTVFREKGVYNERDSKFGNKPTYRLYSKDIFKINSVSL